MMDTVISVLNKTEIVFMNTVEQEFGDEVMPPWMRALTICAFLLILGTNVPLAVFILRQDSKTFLDWLVVFDIFLCSTNTTQLLKFLLISAGVETI